MAYTIAYDRLKTITRDILEGFGYSPKAAELTAHVLVEADARGIPSHGVARLDFYWNNLSKGFARTDQEPEIIWDTPVSLVVDGRDGVGPYVSDFAVDRLILKAQASGAAFCAVKNSNHYGIAGYWAEKMANHHMVAMAFTNTRPCGIATYGRRRLLGTNPIAVAIPEKEGRCFLLDMATTTVAHGKVEVYHRRKKPMPEGWAVDERGRGMTDATAFEELFWKNPDYGGHLFLGGEGELNGGHKGYGLGLLVELLCAGLAMGTWSLRSFAKPGSGSGLCHFFGAFKLDLFGDPQALKDHVGTILQEIRDSEKAEGQDRIYIHGEKEREHRERALKEGIELDEATCAIIDGFAAQTGRPGLPKV